MSILTRLFQRPNPGRDLADIGRKQREQRRRDTTDQLRAQLGLPAWKWGKL